MLCSGILIFDFSIKFLAPTFFLLFNSKKIPEFHIKTTTKENFYIVNENDKLFLSNELVMLNKLKIKGLTTKVSETNIIYNNITQRNEDFNQTSQTFSSIGIHETAKWQFCNTTQVPSRTPFSIIFIAIGP